MELEQEPIPSQPTVDPDAPLDKVALICLSAQHLSVTWTQRTAEFATYLFLIDLFPTTLLPSALYGFFSTLAGVLFAGDIGTLVTNRSRLRTIRLNILICKSSVTIIYGLLLVLLVAYSKEAYAAGEGIGKGGHPVVWTLFALLVLTSCISKLGDIGMSIAVERDWVTTIANGSSSHLTLLNLWLRRIDLMCKLGAPLLTGLLTTTVGNVKSGIVLVSAALGTLGFEIFWIGVVWDRFPVLHDRVEAVVEMEMEDVEDPGRTGVTATTSREGRHQIGGHRRWTQDWLMFLRNPVFPSSLAISLLYFTTLSFDGTMISWMKTNAYSDPLISGMRGVAVLAGLLGTMVMPFLEERIGLARTGNWSIWFVFSLSCNLLRVETHGMGRFEVIALVPALVSFFVGSPTGIPAPRWNQALLFGGISASRIGLWSFDLCQIKLLQLSLVDHPRRGTLTGLQYALQNVLDLLRYVMLVVLS